MADSPTPDSIYTLTEEEIHNLAVLAIEAKKGAYCPYSNFRVGASLLLASAPPSSDLPQAKSLYHTGANIEVASTPNGACAERCMLPHVVSLFPAPSMPVIRALAVSTDIYPPASPCGMCRQVIREFCADKMKVYMYGRTARYESSEQEARAEKVTVMTIGELLPMSFGRSDMDKPRKKVGE